MIKSSNDINNLIQNKMDSVMNMEYNLETEQYIVDVFNKINDSIKPQSIIMKNIKYIKPAIKIDYIIDNKNFTMIVACK